MKANWIDRTRNLHLFNDIFTHAYYYRQLRNFSLVDHRQGLDILNPQESGLFSTFNKFNSIVALRLQRVFSFTTSYRSLFYQSFAENFFFVKQFQKNSLPTLFRLFFKFRTNKLFVTMQNDKFHNLIFLSLGFFLKYFEKRKVLKKSKAFKLLLARTLRKLFLISKLHKFHLFVSGVPIHFIDILRSLNRRIDHPFFNPFEKIPYDESDFKSQLRLIKIPYFFFVKNTSFVPVKTRKRGRIKRKLRRRLIAKNRVTD